MQIEYSGLKFIHWEFHEEFFDAEVIEPCRFQFKMAFVNKPDTQIKIGVLFRWIVRVYTKLGLAIDCIAEEIYFPTPMSILSHTECKRMISIAFNKFKSELMQRSGNEGIIANVEHEVKDDEVEQLLKRLTEK